MEVGLYHNFWGQTPINSALAYAFECRRMQCSLLHAEVAQLAERWIVDPEVKGSTPFFGIYYEFSPTTSFTWAEGPSSGRHPGPSAHDRRGSRRLRTLRLRPPDYSRRRIPRRAFRFRRSGDSAIHLHGSESRKGTARPEVRPHCPAGADHRPVQGTAKAVSPIHGRPGLARG